MRTVIVGAGASGCVLAARLSERADEEITLVEAGPDYKPESLPADLADGRHNALTSHDWGFRHSPNSQQVGMPMPRGRVVGGSSAINTCIAIRGQPQDFDAWAELGLTDWSWDKVLPAFRRLETDLDHDTPWHGRSGPLPIRRHPPEEWTPWQAAFVEACRGLGHADCDDHNAPGATGVGPHAMNKIDGRRISAAEAWLTPDVRKRPNFRLLAQTEAIVVRFRGTRVVGLVVRDATGAQRTLDADRVILCAGCFLTPMILLRSGVGPRAELERLAVEPVAINEGVGSRLLDHPGSAVFFLPKWGKMKRSDPLIQNMCRISTGTTPVPGDVQIQPGSKVPFPWVTFPAVSLMFSIGKPFGVGTIQFPSVRPGASPVITSALLDDDRDRATAVSVLEQVREIAEQPVMRAIARHIIPGQAKLKDAATIDGWIRRFSGSGYHPCGTVPMGADSDPMAATDGHGRVRGVEGLHVADASLIPEIPSSNTHLPSLMIGERIAELLGAPVA